MFRKYYVRNQADISEEHQQEIEQVFNDFGKALKQKGNFINREIESLKGIVDDYLKVDGT